MNYFFPHCYNYDLKIQAMKLNKKMLYDMRFYITKITAMVTVASYQKLHH